MQCSTEERRLERRHGDPFYTVTSGLVSRNFFSLPSLLRGSMLFDSQTLGCSFSDPASFFLLPSMLLLSELPQSCLYECTVTATLFSKSRVDYKSLRPVWGCQIEQIPPENFLRRSSIALISIHIRNKLHYWITSLIYFLWMVYMYMNWLLTAKLNKLLAIKGWIYSFWKPGVKKGKSLWKYKKQKKEDTLLINPSSQCCTTLVLVEAPDCSF